MPEFTTRLKTQEIADLVAYVMTLGGPARPPAPAPVSPPRALTPEARQGRALFFDAARTGACGSCHDLDGWGVPVGPDLAALPRRPLRRFARGRDARRGDRASKGRRAAVSRGVGGTHGSESARLRPHGARSRSCAPSPPRQIALEPGSSWRHEQAARIYTSAELETIAQYLRWLAGL